MLSDKGEAPLAGQASPVVTSTTQVSEESLLFHYKKRTCTERPLEIVVQLARIYLVKLVCLPRGKTLISKAKVKLKLHKRESDALADNVKTHDLRNKEASWSAHYAQLLIPPAVEDSASLQPFFAGLRPEPPLDLQVHFQKCLPYCFTAHDLPLAVLTLLSSTFAFASLTFHKVLALRRVVGWRIMTVLPVSHPIPS